MIGNNVLILPHVGEKTKLYAVLDTGRPTSAAVPSANPRASGAPSVVRVEDTTTWFIGTRHKRVQMRYSTSTLTDMAVSLGFTGVDTVALLATAARNPPLYISHQPFKEHVQAGLRVTMLQVVPGINQSPKNGGLKVVYVRAQPPITIPFSTRTCLKIKSTKSIQYFPIARKEHFSSTPLQGANKEGGNQTVADKQTLLNG